MGSALAQNTKLIDIATGWPAGRGLCRKFLDSAAASFRPAGTRWSPFLAARFSAPVEGADKTAPQGFGMYLGELATARLGPLVTRVMSSGDPRNARFRPVDPPASAAQESHPARKKVPSNRPCLFGRGLGPI